MRIERIVVLLDVSEKAAITEAAEHDGLSASSTLRQLARRELERRGLLPAVERPPLAVGEMVGA